MAQRSDVGSHAARRVALCRLRWGRAARARRAARPGLSHRRDQLLLQLVSFSGGHMTPSEREQRIATYGVAYQFLADALKQFPQTMWQFKAPHDPWTIHEIVGHIADSEVSGYLRCRYAMAESG